MKIRVVEFFKKNPFYEEGIKQLLDSQKQNCYITHCFEENNDKHTVTRNQNWKSCIVAQPTD